MATRIQNQTLDPAAGTSSEPALLEPADFVRLFRDLMERLPQPEVGPGNRAFRRRLAHVDPKFIALAINALATHPAAQAALGLSADDLRASAALIDEWASVADAMAPLQRAILAGNDIRRQRLGLRAMQVYRISEQVARDSGDEKLAAIVREMKRMNKFGRVRSRRRRGQSPPETPPDVLVKPA